MICGEDGGTQPVYRCQDKLFLSMRIRKRISTVPLPSSPRQREIPPAARPTCRSLTSAKSAASVCKCSGASGSPTLWWMSWSATSSSERGDFARASQRITNPADQELVGGSRRRMWAPSGTSLAEERCSGFRRGKPVPAAQGGRSLGSGSALLCQTERLAEGSVNGDQLAGGHRSQAPVDHGGPYRAQDAGHDGGEE